MRYVFIDGYNVINSWPNLKNIKDYSFESARKQLIDILHNYASYNLCRIILVFDAHKVRGNIEKKYVEGNITVVFTKDGETADAYIERMVNDIGRRVEVVVVTSDWLEQQTIFQRGAVRMASLEFYHEVLKVQNKIRQKTERNSLKNKIRLGDNIDESVLEKLERIRRGD